MLSTRKALIGLVGCGAIVLFVHAQLWSVVTFSETGFPETTLRVTGRTLNAVPSAIAVVMVTASLGISSARSLLRRLFASVVGILSLVAAWVSLQMNPADNEATLSALMSDAVGRSVTSGFVYTNSPWRWLSAVACLCAGVMCLVVVRAPKTTTPGPSRYERNESDLTAWQSLDQGQDPTDS